MASKTSAPSLPRRRSNLPRLLLILLQLAMAGVFLYSAYTKFADIFTFGQVLKSYDLLPDALIKPLAILLPIVEALVGLGFLLPVSLPMSAVVAGLLMLFFTVILAMKWGTVMPFGCGCFGPSEAKPVGFVDVGKDVLLMVLCGVTLLLHKNVRS